MARTNQRAFAVSHKNKKKEQDLRWVIEKISDTIGPDVAAKLTNVRFYYEDFHNKSYICKIDNIWAQIRIPKDIVEVNHKNEEKVISHFKDYLYFKDGVIIKKWFPGVDLFKIKVEDSVALAILNCVKNFQNIKIDLERFDWYKYKIYDKRYLELVNKYKDEEYVLSHNNLKSQNILANKYNFVKLIDFEFSSYNSRYFDPVSLYLFLGIDKEKIIKFFNLKREKFDDYCYLIRTYNEAMFKNVYANLKAPNSIISESLNEYNSRDFLIQNRFIVQKQHNKFNDRLKIETIENLYFVPVCVYEDEDRIIWRWLNCPRTIDLNLRQTRVLAKAIRTLHDSDYDFPEYILDQKIKYYLDFIQPKQIEEDFGDVRILKEIQNWVKNIKPDANNHNHLSLDNIFFTENLNLYIIDWASAYRSNRFIDIALLFENSGFTKAMEKVFWKSYGYEQPADFYKYRIIIHFVGYLYNRVLNGDYSGAGVNVSRIKELWRKFITNKNKEHYDRRKTK
ncbi:hypothetical protein FJO69_00750 [[Mycoplasma] falconis]|uniref:Uncharacterized protein n=1 Tax=[Mycoplasma] falconis TaxID=92403 RepID=A0A501XB07_9BACT|nr:hypothetical protein [[Mycoplasma] falconis]TPE57712.1 hypothetical protein FJO69_00750 [[Mycoplasma] falconis]